MYKILTIATVKKTISEAGFVSFSTSTAVAVHQLVVEFPTEEEANIAWKRVNSQDDIRAIRLFTPTV